MNAQPHRPTEANGLHHFIDLSDWDGERVRKLLKDALRLKKAHAHGKNKPLLQGRVLGLMFEKPSLRTRVSFQAGMAQLGGAAIFLNQTESGLGNRESLPDIARTLSQFVDAVVLRTFRHETVEEFARWSSCPVINGLSDYAHPCQALGDLLTLGEIFDGKLAGRSVVFVGDGNNVARSLALACAKVGVQFVLSAPPGYGFDARFLDLYRGQFGMEPVQELDPLRAVATADVIYTDVWASMGQEDQADQRRRSFAGYQVNHALLSHAPAHARVMHCLPAHRGEEITDSVLDGPQSVVFEQAGNRMHAQKALLLWVMGQ
jgi:ornithine carbamoyltransferase